MDAGMNAKHENALLKKFNKRVDDAVKSAKEQHDVYKKCRDAVDLSNATERKVTPFLIFSTLSALVPALYAKNPEIEVRPTALAQSEQGLSKWTTFAVTAEDLLQQEFVIAANLKRRMKSGLLSTLTTGVGWLKVTLQDEIANDALQYNRLPDAQDNVAEIRALQKALGESGSDEEAIKAELSVQTAHVESALRGEAELFVQKGLVIDRVNSEDLFVLDESIHDLGDYLNAQAIGQRVWMLESEYKKVFDVQERPKGVSLYGADKNEDTRDAANGGDKLVQVWEVWDKASGHVYTFARGATEWAREPYQPAVVGERWYPFFGLMFNHVDGRKHPLSDVQLLIDFQDEYAHLRSQIRNSRQYNKPVFIVPSGGDLSSVQADRIVKTVRDTEDGTWLAANIPPGQPIGNSVQQFPIPQLNHALFSPDMIFRDVEMTTRSGDAARGYVNKAKTATEAEIMSMGMQSGISERQDVLEDLMRDMAIYALEIMVQAYSPEDVQRVLGANVVWQNMSIEAAFKHLALDIKAGSMSKPNKFQEREQWMQLMPIMQQTIQQMAQLQMQGMHGMAGALRKMLEETIDRFDERIDLDEFIPDLSQDLMQQQMAQTMAQTGGGM